MSRVTQRRNGRTPSRGRKGAKPSTLARADAMASSGTAGSSVAPALDTTVTALVDPARLAPVGSPTPRRLVARVHADRLAGLVVPVARVAPAAPASPSGVRRASGLATSRFVVMPNRRAVDATTVRRVFAPALLPEPRSWAERLAVARRVLLGVAWALVWTFAWAGLLVLFARQAEAATVSAPTGVSTFSLARVRAPAVDLSRVIDPDPLRQAAPDAAGLVP